MQTVTNIQSFCRADDSFRMPDDAEYVFDPSSKYDSSVKMEDCTGDYYIKTEDDMYKYPNNTSPFYSYEGEQATSVYSSSYSPSYSPCSSSSPSPPLTSMPSTDHHPQSSPLSHYRSSLLSPALEHISITDTGLGMYCIERSIEYNNLSHVIYAIIIFLVT